MKISKANCELAVEVAEAKVLNCVVHIYTATVVDFYAAVDNE